MIDALTRYPVVEQDEFERLYSEWLATHDNSIRDRIIHGNIKLVLKIASHYMKRSFGRMAWDDMVQEGLCGLIKAFDRYDSVKGGKFSVYASYWIKTFIRRRALDKMLAVSYGTTENLKSLSIRRNVVSMHEHVNNDDDAPEIGDVLMADDMGDQVRQMQNDINDLKKILTDRERHVIDERYPPFGEPKKLKELADELNVSCERVRQIETDALAKLREACAV